MGDSTNPITVALVDDQELFRAGIRMLIESQQDMELVAEAGDGEEAVALAARLCPDVMLMDLRMPGMDGVTATRRIAEESLAAGTDKPRIIALTTFNRDQAVVEAVQAGASGYLLKSAEPEFLFAAIRTVYSGYSVIAPGSIHELFAHAARSFPVADPDLSVLEGPSARERDVFLLAAKGLGNCEIAGSLFVSEATVKTHLRSVLDKLGLRARPQLVALSTSDVCWGERTMMGGAHHMSTACLSRRSSTEVVGEEALCWAEVGRSGVELSPSTVQWCRGGGIDSGADFLHEPFRVARWCYIGWWWGGSSGRWGRSIRGVRGRFAALIPWGEVIAPGVDGFNGAAREGAEFVAGLQHGPHFFTYPEGVRGEG
ncbi:response regulator transcription factor [Arthrobacter alpinus]|uniref:response regulator transcription factor n=1 Tax=Arthrobacter alpinus TaxID=656366 RepID=UPI0028F6DFF3|nr:response regulator transcription factor [Arthrobacter alpinus]